MACATSALVDQGAPVWMVPWAECDTSVMSTLPPVWLNNHVYQKVTATVPKTLPTKMDGWKPPSKKKVGRCQPVMSTARIKVVRSGERVVCSPGRAKPRQPGSSPNGPSRGLIRRTANTMRRAEKGPIAASEGAPAPSATFSTTVTRRAASGSPTATTYQYHLTRHRIIRKLSSRSPDQPRVMGITMRAAISGPVAKKGIGQTPAAYKGKPTHEIA